MIVGNTKFYYREHVKFCYRAKFYSFSAQMVKNWKTSLMTTDLRCKQPPWEAKKGPFLEMTAHKNGFHKWPLEIQGLRGCLQELAQQQIDIGNAKICLLALAILLFWQCCIKSVTSIKLREVLWSVTSSVCEKNKEWNWYNYIVMNSSMKLAY